MSKINLKNMPNCELYEFAPGLYVWKILRAGGTRNANYLTSLEKTTEQTEVFQLENDGTLSCIWSGYFSRNPSQIDENGLDKFGCFYIFSSDEDCGRDFKQEHELKKANLELQTQALEMEKYVVSHIQKKLDEKKRGRRF